MPDLEKLDPTHGTGKTSDANPPNHRDTEDTSETKERPFIRNWPPDKQTLKSNPKDLIGNLKLSIQKLPPAGIIHGAHGMMNGAEKYGPYNWRENAVVASIYIDAISRHLLAWQEGEEIAPDSGVHHLGHIIANAAILLDAQETGNLKDDRAKSPNGAASILAKINKILALRGKK